MLRAIDFPANFNRNIFRQMRNAIRDPEDFIGDVFTDAARSAELLERHATLERGIAAGFTELEKSTEVFGS